MGTTVSSPRPMPDQSRGHPVTVDPPRSTLLGVFGGTWSTSKMAQVQHVQLRCDRISVSTFGGYSNILKRCPLNLNFSSFSADQSFRTASAALACQESREFKKVNVPPIILTGNCQNPTMLAQIAQIKIKTRLCWPRKGQVLPSIPKRH